MSDHSGSDKVMGIDAEASTVTQNLKGDSVGISKYVVNRCGDFTLDDERAAFIAAFLRAAATFAKVQRNQ